MFLRKRNMKLEILSERTRCYLRYFDSPARLTASGSPKMSQIFNKLSFPFSRTPFTSCDVRLLLRNQTSKTEIYCIVSVVIKVRRQCGIVMVKLSSGFTEETEVETRGIISSFAFSGNFVCQTVLTDIT